MQEKDHPISRIEWIEADSLIANDYNPNVVFTKEMELLRLSILKNGWIQPVLVTSDLVIIDGFHRASLARYDKQVRALTNGKVPCVKMELTEPERMLLTVRINRAKGSHIAIKMSDLIKRLVNDWGMPLDEIARQIGATRDEVDLLLMDDVFKKLNINKETKYSKAWVVRKPQKGA